MSQTATPLSVDDIDFTAPVPPGGYMVPPAVNLKCIMFTAALALSYWYLPAQNKYVLAALCIFPYLWLSYYDVAYGAKRNMGPTYLGDFYDWAKVPDSKQIRVWKHWNPAYKMRVHLVDLAVLLVLIAALPVFMRWKPQAQTEEEAAANRRAAAFFALCVASCVLCRMFLRASE
jgi:hypothetical protein